MTIDTARAKSIFLAASELPNLAERADYLAQQCGSNGPLRARVEALLRAHDAAADLGDEPSGPGYDPTIIKLVSENPGLVIVGRYKLLEAIGEGGMGSVWLAEQKEPVRRKVAVKLVKAGMDSKQVLSRFEAERQALAMMDHPNIAKVFDGGITEQGRPFFVMEFVKGVPLTNYCDQAKLSIQERLQLFLPVCQAVQHAHQKGVIHRDLKPSNILICLYDGKPVPKVIDFGLAKAMHQSLTAHSLHTAIGMMVGTPLYMSPEQAEHNNLDVDTRTDIYSLGVILYELLTGSTPLERQQMKAAAFNEILRLIKEVEPPKPSTRLSGSASLPSIAAQRNIDPKQLSRSLAGDLDWIVMKALDKERGRRYETANGFARDIERYLGDEAVEACPPSRFYRLTKFVRRNRGQVITASVMLSMLVAGILGTSVGLFRALDAERRAKDESVRAGVERERAMRAEASSRERADEAIHEKARADQKAALADAVSEFLRSDVLAATPYRVEPGSSSPITVEQAVDLAAARIATRFAGRPELEAQVRSTMGNTYLELRQLDKAAEQLTRSVELFRTLKIEDQESVRAVQLLAWVRLQQNQLAESETLHREALKIAERVLPEENLVRMTAVGHLAHCLSEAGKFAEAGPFFERAISESLRARGETRGLQMIRNNLALSYVWQGEPEKALPVYREALERHQELTSPRHPNTQLLIRNLANALRKLERWSEVEVLAREALEGARFLHSIDSEIESSIYLGQALRGSGRSQEIEKVLADVAETLEKHPIPWSVQTIIWVERLLVLADEVAGTSGAERLDRVAISGFRDSLTELRIRGNIELERQSLADCLARTGLKLLLKQRWDDAEPLLRECLSVREKTIPDSWQTFNSRSMLGAALLGQQKYRDAEPLLEKGYEGLKTHAASIPAEARPRMTEALNRLIELSTRLERPEDVMKWQAELERHLAEDV